jgi:hypothetical protein
MEPALEKVVWLDGRGRSVLQFEQRESPTKSYALLVLKLPWTTVPIPSEAKPHLRVNNGLSLIDIEDRRQIVVRKLREKNAEKNYIEYCSYDPSHRESIESGEIENLYICFQGADYIAWLWMGSDPILKEKLPRSEPTALEQVRYLYGVYHCDMHLANEDHSFVLDINEDEITVYNTYGGTREFFITTFDREQWTESFLNFSRLPDREQAAHYHELWGFHPGMSDFIFEAEHKPIVFSDLKIFRIY